MKQKAALDVAVTRLIWSATGKKNWQWKHTDGTVFLKLNCFTTNISLHQQA